MAGSDKSAPRRRWLKVSYSNDDSNDNHAYSSPKAFGSRVPSTRDICISSQNDKPNEIKRRVRKRTPPKTQSRAERASALAELSKRRKDLASRRISGCQNPPITSRAFADEGKSDSDEDDTSSESNFPTFEDVEKITIRRSKLGKWFMEPFFDELIAGCFVRVRIGYKKFGVPVYRLCTVRNVDATKSEYRYRFENRTTYKYLDVIWGNERSAARWMMTSISDSPPLRAEFDQLVREAAARGLGGFMPTKKDVSEKLSAINKINSFVYTAAAVRRMLDEKRAAGWGPRNIAAEKARLRAEMVRAGDDVEERERIEARLRKLEEEASVPGGAGKDEKGFKLAELNRKNKIENLKIGSKVSTSFENGGGYDPFSRRWTKSRNYYAMSSVGEINGGGVERVLAKKSGDVSSVGGAGGLVDTSAPLDQGKESNKMHDFELSISLAALEKFGGAKGAREGFMANKQRIEATQGCKAPVDDHPKKRARRILTVDEYRNRRGLI